MEGVNSRKRPILDWGGFFDGDDAEPPQIEIVKSGVQPPKPPLMAADQPADDDFASLNNQQLQEKIKSCKRTIEQLSSKLKDNGEKIRARLSIMEEEYRRREQARAQQKLDTRSNNIQSTSSDGTDPHSPEYTLSGVNSQSEFASHFNRKIEGNKNNAFDEEFSLFGRRDQQIMKSRGATFQHRRKKDPQSSSSRQSSFRCVSSFYESISKPSAHLKGKTSSTSFRQDGESLSSNLMKKKYNFRDSYSNGSSRKGQTIVLVDEDDTQVAKTDRENRIAESMKDKKIYYPSRDDPESVEICFSDIDCLAPEGFLTSEIMNFYIRYLRLQKSPMDNALCDYHFFTTFFYKKLKQAVSHKGGSDKESFFVKFRRWWKGINIFQKAYIFIPIHEDLHWSLVIICIPDKEDKSGPIILHLDSLGLHSSRLVFEDIKSFLKQEWKYLNESGSPLDLPIDDHIWEYLPRRIDEKKIEVPQQRNDYDCGIFVLFFMERFIEEAPERLKKKDLAMFGKRWFRPEEASGLRVKIRNLLLDAFEKASVSNDMSETPSPSSDGATP